MITCKNTWDKTSERNDKLETGDVNKNVDSLNREIKKNTGGIKGKTN